MPNLIGFAYSVNSVLRLAYALCALVYKHVVLKLLDQICLPEQMRAPLSDQPTRRLKRQSKRQKYELQINIQPLYSSIKIT